MPQLEFPLGFEGSENLPQTRRSLQNCFNIGNNRLLSRPGITQLNTTSGVARGQFVWNDALYQVVSEQLIKITDVTTGAFSVIGTIDGAAVVETAVGFNNAVIVVKSAIGSIYTLDSADTLVEIWDGPTQTGNANFASCTDVTHIDDRFIYIPFDGDPAFFSDVGAAGTVQALSFFDAQTLPDKNNSVFSISNTLFICCTDSFEPFRNTGASPNPFVRISGGGLNYGFVGALIDYGDTFLFIGRKRNEGYGIFAIGQGTAPKISNEAIDLILTQYTPTELGNAIGGRLNWRGYDIATFTLANDSFGFLNGNWFLLDTVENDVSEPWHAGFITQLDGKYYSAFEDRIGVFEKVNTDYGERITYIIDTGYNQEDNDFFTLQNIELGISQGFSSTIGSVALFMSRNNVTYGEPFYRDLGIIGEYNKHLLWNFPGGMGAYNGFMGIRIYTTEDVIFNFSYMVGSFR